MTQEAIDGWLTHDCANRDILSLLSKILASLDWKSAPRLDLLAPYAKLWTWLFSVVPNAMIPNKKNHHALKSLHQEAPIFMDKQEGSLKFL